MSGHSKWATTKHKKAVIDAKRGKLFAKLIKNIEVAARTGGGDPDGQPDAVRRHPEGEEELGPQRQHRPRGQARARAWRPAAPTTQTIMYEGYGPNGVAVLIECLTDNRNRAASDVRVAMTRNGGSMADPGSVSYLFNRKGVVIVPKDDGSAEDDVLGAVLDAGAEEVNDLGEAFEVVTEATDLVAGAHRAAGRGHRLRVGRRQLRPQRCRSSSTRKAPRKIFRLIDALEDSDDVQNVYANFDVSDESWRGRRLTAPLGSACGCGRPQAARSGLGRPRPGRHSPALERRPVRRAARRRRSAGPRRRFVGPPITCGDCRTGGRARRRPGGAACACSGSTRA